MNQRYEKELSIVIAAWNSTEYLETALESLERQIDDDSIEVIVASNLGSAAEELGAAFPFVDLALLQEDTTVPELRAAGVTRAKGKIVALLEDHCTAGENWCSEVIRAHRSAHAIVGGAIENGPDQAPLDWAVYFYDYGKYMLPVNEKTVNALSGANVSYKRQVLSEIGSAYSEGFYESTVNEELRKRGQALYMEPGAVVFHNKHYVLKEALAESYHHARTYAARRISGADRSKGLAMGLLSFVLPFVLASRITLGVLRKRRHFKELLRSSPYLLPLVTAWAYGEFCGYLFGEGKSSLEWK